MVDFKSRGVRPSRLLLQQFRQPPSPQRRLMVPLRMSITLNPFRLDDGAYRSFLIPSPTLTHHHHRLWGEAGVDHGLGMCGAAQARYDAFCSREKPAGKLQQCYSRGRRNLEWIGRCIWTLTRCSGAQYERSVFSPRPQARRLLSDFPVRCSF